ncbi:MAG TPA: ferritin-like domain-containing protein [Cytophagaceae bacterium]
MKIKTMNDLFTDMVKDVYSAESQLIKAFPRMAKRVNSEELRMSFEQHLKETEIQKERLEQVAEILDITPRGKKCAAMEGLLTEAEEVMEEIADPELLDAALIAANQKVEHYEIASYGTLATLAKMMGNKEILDLLVLTLEEEKATDLRLTELAVNVINEKAAQA